MSARSIFTATAFAGVLAASSLVHAQTIDYFQVTKVQDFQQTSSNAPASHSILTSPDGAFDFRAEMSGSRFDLLSGLGSLALPNATQQTLVDLDPGYYDFYGIIHDYSSKSALDAAYPDGNYTFKFTAPGGQLGQPTAFNVTIGLGATDDFPAEVPTVTNGTWDGQGNLLVNAAVGTTLNFNSYSGYTTGVGGIISFDIYGLNGTTLISNPYDVYSTSLAGQGADPQLTTTTIPANTLQANQIYYAELAFIRVVNVSQDYKQALSLPVYQYVTGIMISTYPASTSPGITTQPVSQTVAVGGTVTFSAAASGTPTPTYQWQKNSVNIPGATGTTYSISNVAASDAGDYRCVATNSAGSATSNAATLTVLVPHADFNGDLKSDLVWENTSTGERYVWLMNDTGFASSVSLGVVPAQWHVAATADFNGDGKADLVWENTSTGERYVWLMNGTVFSSSVFLGVVPTNWQIVGAGDFNGDGKADLVWQNSSTGERYVWLMNGTVFSSSVFLGVVPTAWQIAGAADFNGDGKADIVWENTATGERYVWLMNGTAYSSNVLVGVVPTQWRISGTGDFNHDGKADLIWQNTSTGECYLWLMNGTTFSASVVLGVVPTQWQISE